MKNRIILFSVLTILWLLGPVLFALDLKFTSAITMTPASPSAGATITFVVSFVPQGGAVTNFKITGGVDTTQVYERTFASIPAGTTRTVSFTWTSTTGNHTAWFVLDPDHLMGDANYGNNRVELAFRGGTVVEMATPHYAEISARILKPDLIVSSIKLTHASYDANKMFYAIKFKNQGSICVSAFNWKMYSPSLNGSELCSTCPQGRFAAVSPLCALKAGEEKTINGFFMRSDFSNEIKEDCPAPFLIIKHKHYNKVYVIIDYDNKVVESNEDNNQSRTYTVVWQNDCD